MTHDPYDKAIGQFERTDQLAQDGYAIGVGRDGSTHATNVDGHHLIILTDGRVSETQKDML